MQIPTQPFGAPAKPAKKGFDINQIIIQVKKALFSTPMTMKDFTTRMEIGAGVLLFGVILIVIALLI